MKAWLPLQSSAISAVAYQGSSLYIRFIDNHEYEYYHVPKIVYEDLISAPSKGQYFNRYIKDHYDFIKMN